MFLDPKKMSNENLQMQIIAEAVQKSTSVQFVSDSPITDPGTKVSQTRNLIEGRNKFIKDRSNVKNPFTAEA